MQPSNLISATASFCIAAAAAAAFMPMSAHASLALAQKSTCTACHAAERKLVGPSFKEIAKRHSAEKGTADAMAASIRAGGSGKWGPVPMPAQPKLSEADALALAVWIMGTAK